MKERMLIAITLGGMLYLQNGFGWAANNPGPDQESKPIHDQQQMQSGQPVMKQIRTGNESTIKIESANTGKVQGPAPVILQIKLVNKPTD